MEQVAAWLDRALDAEKRGDAQALDVIAHEVRELTLQFPPRGCEGRGGIDLSLWERSTERQRGRVRDETGRALDRAPCPPVPHPRPAPPPSAAWAPPARGEGRRSSGWRSKDARSRRPDVLV